MEMLGHAGPTAWGGEERKDLELNTQRHCRPIRRVGIATHCTLHGLNARLGGQHVIVEIDDGD
jgi:hypothetical protein